MQISQKYGELILYRLHPPSWLQSIPVAKTRAADMAALQTIITETPVQNDVQRWCCQDYVIEALERSNEEKIVED